MGGQDRYLGDNMALKLISDRERFLQSIKIVRYGEWKCWEWQKFIDPDGYGKFKVAGKSIGAHRWSYEEFVGLIPKGLQLDHLCRNRKCANFAHVEPVTALVNTRRGWRANKTICKHGHPLFGENLYVGSDGRRQCKICRTRLVAEYVKRKGKKYILAYQRKWRKNRRLQSE